MADWDHFQREMLAALGHELLQAAPVAATRTSAVPDGPPLWQALFRAAGGDPARLSGLPPLDQLRTPAAKRALWPRLRALRRDAQR
jgi:hypothetical protein